MMWKFAYLRHHPHFKRVYVLAAIAIMLGLFEIFVDVEIRDGYFGLFILKRDGAPGVEIVNDIYPDDMHRLLVKFDFKPLYDQILSERDELKGTAHLNYVWDKKRGRGFVENHFIDGTRLLTSLSRFVDNTGNVSRGIFIGGELPGTEFNGGNEMNDTGMAYFDGKRWLHIWCSSNEGLASGLTMKNTPLNLSMTSSAVLRATDFELHLKSEHAAFVDGQPLFIERFALFEAGEPYMILVQRITNRGTNPASYFYIYGDEPWLGRYGSSKGNIGWTKDHLVLYEEMLDTKKHSFAGFYDYGNDAVNEGHNFTFAASFIEWIGPDVPEIAFFVNQEQELIREARKNVPLGHPHARFFGVQWGPVYLFPGQSQTIALAIGMAKAGSDGKIPVKPPVKFRFEEFPYRLVSPATNKLY